MKHDDDGAYDHHAMDSVGTRHQWGVEHGRDIRNDFDPQKNGNDDEKYELSILVKNVQYIFHELGVFCIKKDVFDSFTFDLSIVCYASVGQDVIFPIEMKLSFFIDQKLEEVHHVLAIHLAGI